MADANTVMGELKNDGDVVVIYDGAQGMFSEGGRRTGSLRYALFKLIWDLLRFQKIGDKFFDKPFDPATAYGMRDMVTRTLKLTEENNALLKQLVGQLTVGTPKKSS